jgi:hypothetical protein
MENDACAANTPDMHALVLGQVEQTREPDICLFHVMNVEGTLQLNQSGLV